MKSGIHPEYAAAKITCACGRSTEASTTVGEIHVEICSHCHPFFTGKQKLVDTAGRVERFRTRYRSSEAKSKKGPARATAEPEAADPETAPETAAPETAAPESATPVEVEPTTAEAETDHAKPADEEPAAAES